MAMVLKAAERGEEADERGRIPAFYIVMVAFAFWIAVVVETLMMSIPARETGTRIGKATVSSACGFVVMSLLWLLALLV